MRLFTVSPDIIVPVIQIKRFRRSHIVFWLGHKYKFFSTWFLCKGSMSIMVSTHHVHSSFCQPIGNRSHRFGDVIYDDVLAMLCALICPYNVWPFEMLLSLYRCVLSRCFEFISDNEHEIDTFMNFDSLSFLVDANEHGVPFLSYVRWKLPKLVL